MISNNTLLRNLLTFTCLWVFAASAVADETELTAREIIDTHVSKHNIDSEVEFVTMKTIEPDGQTTRHAILFCTQRDENGNHQYLLRVVSPKNYEGVGLLARKVGDEYERYFYLPALKQVKKVVGGGKSPNFLGSNFTYEDLVKETPERYVYERLEDKTVDGIECYVIRSYPNEENENTKTPYMARDIFFGKDDFNIYGIHFYGDDPENPAKTLRCFDYASVDVDGPTMRPKRAFMTDHVNGTTSELAVMRSRFNEPLPQELFEPDNLSNWGDDQKKEILAIFSKPSSNPEEKSEDEEEESKEG